MTLGYLVWGVAYFDFICIGLEVLQMPKKGAFGYDMNHAKVDEWSREDSPLQVILGEISRLFLA